MTLPGPQGGRMSLHGFEVKQGKPTPYVPPPETARLFLKNAALPADAGKNARASLMIKSQDMDKPLCLGTLSKKGMEQMSMELVLDEYTELSVVGNCAIHVVGVASSDAPDDDSDDMDEDDLAVLKGMRLMAGGDGEDDDDDDDDYNESDDSDVPRLEELPVEAKKALPNGQKKVPIVESPPTSNENDDDDDNMNVDDDDDDDDDDEDDDSDTPAPSPPQPTPPKQQEKKKGKGKHAQAAAPAAAAAKDDAPPPTPQQKQKQKAAGKEQKGVKRDAAAIDTPPPKKAKDTKQKAAETPVSAAATASPASTATTAPTPTPSPAPAKKRKDTRRFKNGFVIHNMKYGNPEGKVSEKGKNLVVSYVGKLENGQVFDKTKGKQTFEFKLGAGQVIRGWDKGLEDMRVGDKRKLTVPPSMGYGAEGSPPAIPPNATLTFEISLENVK